MLKTEPPYRKRYKQSLDQLRKTLTDVVKGSALVDMHLYDQLFPVKDGPR